MKELWQSLAFRIDALALRERGMIFLCLVLILVVMMNFFLLQPQLAQERTLARQLAENSMKLNTLVLQIRNTVIPPDPDADKRARLAQVESELKEVKQSLDQMQKGLVPPEKMTGLLESVMSRNPRVKLVGLRTLPTSSLSDSIMAMVAASGTTPQGVGAAPAKVENPLAQSIYRHGVEIVVQGEYFDLIQYLAQLEAIPMQVFWGKVDLKVDTYPKSTLTLHVYTMSLEQSWLSL